MRRLKRKVVRTSQYRGFGDFPAAGKDRDVRISCAAAFVVFFAAMTLSGCQSEAPYFRPNLVEIEIEQDAGEPVTEDQQRTINETMLAMFGTPDHPANPFPQDDELVDAISPLKTFGFDVEKLKIAAGPAYRDQQGNQHGLYRLHCAHCHGVSGGGDGPTAPFLNPYPRDYRQGVFKYKSTFGAAKPTHDDLKRVLIHGVAGTSMPSFRTLPDNEIEALVEYVRYLSVRGETEVRVIEYLAAEGEMPGSIAEIAGGFPLALDDEGIPEEEPEEENVVASVVYQWDSAPLQEIHPVSSPIDYSKPGSEAMQASIARGEKLFYSKNLQCNSCHGDSAQGDGQRDKYTVWFKWREDLGTNNDDPAEIERVVHQFMEVGALQPRTIHPRNLRLGVYRGGRRPIDVYRRIYSGINGGPMPAQGTASGIGGNEVPDDEAGGSIRREQIWDVVSYVLSLPYEPLSQGPPQRQGSKYTPR